MNLKLQAMKKTAGVFAITFIAAIILLQLFLIPPEILVWGLIIGLLGFFVWIVYSITLSKLQIEQSQEK
jgi:fatty acid desaturase